MIYLGQFTRHKQMQTNTDNRQMMHITVQKVCDPTNFSMFNWRKRALTHIDTLILQNPMKCELTFWIRLSEVGDWLFSFSIVNSLLTTYLKSEGPLCIIYILCINFIQFLGTKGRVCYNICSAQLSKYSQQQRSVNGRVQHMHRATWWTVFVSPFTSVLL